jgi:integrase/recombinase XerD
VSDLAPLLQGSFTDKLMRHRQASPTRWPPTATPSRCCSASSSGAAAGRPPSSAWPTSTRQPSARSCTTWRPTGTTPPPPATPAWPPCARCFATPRRAPHHAALIQRVLAIPTKRFDRAIVSFLTPAETDALLPAPDRTTWTGRRDHALLLVALHTGLRVSELIGLRLHDVHLGTGPHLRCHGKGRKDRCTPLTTPTGKVLRAWLAERGGQHGDPLFPTRRGTPLSRDAVQRLVAKHAAAAAVRCPSLQHKKVTPHTLRHSTAMALLHASVDISVIALWPGHESTETTQTYLNSQELQQTGEKLQVTSSVRVRSESIRSIVHAAWPGVPVHRARQMHDPAFWRAWLEGARSVTRVASRPEQRAQIGQERGRPGAARSASERTGPLLPARCGWLDVVRPDRAFRQFRYPTPPVHADMTIKERALARTTPPGTTARRYRAPDTLLAFLNSL